MAQPQAHRPDQLGARYWASASRAVVHNDRAWKELLNEKIRQVESLELGVADVLMLCANSQTGTVATEDIYEILAKVRM